LVEQRALVGMPVPKPADDPGAGRLRPAGAVSAGAGLLSSLT